jgi:uroporphyrinogen-III synthase
MDTPLAGLNIVVTRPREQAAQLAQRIEQAGGKVVLFPLLEISPTTDPQSLRALIARLNEFDLAIFISPNAVRYGMEAIRSTGELPAKLKIATVGQGSAKALRDLGIQEVIAPMDRFDSEALLTQPALQNVPGWRVVIFRGNGGRELLGDALKTRGATVEYAECYRRSKPQQDSTALLATDPHAITVTSSEALSYLWDMSDAASRERLAAVPLFVPHARIADVAHALGWRNVIATTEGDDGLLSSLVAWAQDRKSL